MEVTKKALGCMYGQVIGDSLGSRYEFRPASVVREMIINDSVNSFLPMIGGGPFHLLPGQVTDDSEMALSLASSIIRCGTFNAADVACSYVFWSQSQPPDIGYATRNALTIGKRLSLDWHRKLSGIEKEEIRQEVLNNVKVRNAGSLSNGCLMRISPLAIYSISVMSVKRIEEMVLADCSLTHFEKDAVQAVFSYVMAIRHLINGKSYEALTLLKLVRNLKYQILSEMLHEAFESALNATQSKRIRGHLLTAREKPIPVNIGDKFVDGDGKAMGYIGVALQSAFYELLHGTSFTKSLINAISRGGDTDTNAAIVGALIGARFGVDDIPEQWINTVRKCEPRANFNVIDYDIERIVYNLLELNHP